MAMKSVEHRKVVYALVEKWRGRPLTHEEHEELKGLLTAMNHDATKDLIASNANMSSKLKPMGKSLWKLLHSKGVPLDELVFLRQALELSDADLESKKTSSEKPKKAIE